MISINYKIITICILILLIIIIIYLINKSNNKEYFSTASYLPALPENVSNTIVDTLKNAINSEIEKLSNMPINVPCAGGTLSSIKLHTDTCQGPAYTKQGGCKFNIPAIGCGCYEQLEAGLTRVTGLDSLRVTDINNLFVNTNYVSGKVTVLMDIELVTSITIYGTAKATFPVCVKSMIGLDDNYLVETKLKIKFNSTSISGTQQGKNLVLDLSTFNVGSINVDLYRTNWFAKAPGVIKTILDNTLGLVGDVWWSAISLLFKCGGTPNTTGSLNPKYSIAFNSNISKDKIIGRTQTESCSGGILDLSSILTNAVKRNTKITIPYVGYIVPASLLLSTISNTYYSIGLWTISSVDGNLLFSSSLGKGHFTSDMKWIQKSTLSAPSTLPTVLPPMIHLGGWIVFATPKNDSLIFYKPDSSSTIQLNATSDGGLVWIMNPGNISKTEITEFDSGLVFSCLTVGDFKFLQPFIRKDLIIYNTKSKVSSNNSIVILDTNGSIKNAKWLDIPEDQIVLESLGGCSTKVTDWTSKDWCVSVGDHYKKSRSSPIGCQKVGLTNQCVPVSNTDFANRFASRFSDWNCSSVMKTEGCARILRDYPNFSKLGNGLSTEQIKSQYGSEPVQDWIDFGCTNYKVQSSICEQIKSNYNIGVDGSNLCKLTNRDRVKWNENKCKPEKQFSSC